MKSMLYHALSIEITCLLEIVKKIENIFLELNFTTDKGRVSLIIQKHYVFGVDKNERTNNYYKPTIRIFKNIKTIN